MWFSRYKHTGNSLRFDNPKNTFKVYLFLYEIILIIMFIINANIFETYLVS